MAPRVVAPPPAGYTRVRMTVAYDGTPFHGFATNPDVRTVQDDIECALATVLRQPTPTTCAGRTDRGVHARGQVMSFDVDAAHFDADALTRALNRMLSPHIAVRDVVEVASDFDARLSCVARSYRYHIMNAPTPDPLLHNRAWHVRERLEVEPMQVAADRILGEHDFTSFSKRNKSKANETFVRRVEQVQWFRNGDAVHLDITANAFTHQMVRSLVGMFVAVGRGRRPAADIDVALGARDRAVVPTPAPPQGLVLMQARYRS